MPTVPLPDDPSLAQLRKQAKDVRNLAAAGVEGALQLVGAHHPDGPHAVSLAGAQLVVARHYGFSSWARLKRHVEVIAHYRRAPDEVEDPTDPADQFLALACLRYGDDAPERWRRAGAVLAAHPELVRDNIWVAATVGDEAAVSALLARDPTLANRQGGPYGWEPLLYLVYARHDPTLTREAVLGTTRRLLAAGADPNAGYLWHGLTCPFTALTGAFGAGEGDQPEHPHGFVLASLLLESGADANDGQTLYNRQFARDDRHLVLLLRHGLGQGDGGPWRARLGDAVDAPAYLLRVQLWWAIVHDMRERVMLLVDHGVDFRTPFVAPGGRPSWARTSDGRTPAEVAALSGCPEVVDLLVARGAERPPAEGVDGLIAAVLAEDEAEVARLAPHADAARSERPALMVWAAARGKRRALAVLAGLGFDVNAKGRTDVPMEQAWETALHEAASTGDVDMARLLLDLGADVSIHDTRFDATPLGWAHHFEQPATVALLEPLTPPGA